MAIFNEAAKTYDSWYETKLGNFVDKVETECAFDLLQVKEGMTVLDVGCGTGNFSIKLAEMGCKVIGIDLSDEMLGIARQKISDKNLDIEFYNMDIYNLTFEDEKFDAVFSMAAFEFIKETEKALDEIFRVTKKGGSILVGTINKDSSWGELYMTDEVRENSVFKYADFKTVDDFTKLRKEHLKGSGGCLFIPPGAEEKDINMENERILSKSERPGYFCVLWEK